MNLSLSHGLRRRRLTAALLAGAIFSSPAMAALDDAKAILQVLLNKGVITQSDYDKTLDEWNSKPSDSVSPVQFVQDALGVQAKEVQQAVENTKKDEKNGSVKSNGLGLVSADGDSSVNITGMVHFDSHQFNTGLPNLTDKDSASVADQFEFRRVRLGVNGSIAKNIDYEVIINATGTDTNILDTGFITLNSSPHAQWQFGRFRQPYSLESMTKDGSIDFMERSYGDQLGPNKLLGAGVAGVVSKGVTYGFAVAQSQFSELSNTAGTLGGLYTGRFTVNPAEWGDSKDKVVHFGFSSHVGTSYSTPTTSLDTGNTSSGTTRATILSFRSEDRGLSSIYRAQIGGDSVTAAYGASANNVAEIKKELNDLEFAYASGAFKFQTEYAVDTINSTATAITTAGASATSQASLALTAQTLYYELIYNITGENWADAYKNGSFTGIKPKSNYVIGEGGTGAWQVGARLSSYKVSLAGLNTGCKNTSTIQNGTYCLSDGANGTSRAENSETANTITLGLNWLLNPNTVFKLNYATTSFGRPVSILSSTLNGTTSSTASTTTRENVVSLRAQVNF